jgi:hypothetical protein
MSKFIGHIPCPSCGSKDNLAEYDDHLFCFGCKYWKSKNTIEGVRRRLLTIDEECPNDLNLDLVLDIPKEAMQWLLQYEITSKDCETYHITWCPSRKALVLIYLPHYYQARNFNEGPKYLSKGNKPLLFYGNSDTIVIVEDVLSAIKVSKANNNYTGCPLLGSSMPLKLTETILERFKKVWIWLDRDKAIDAVKMARNLKQKGIDADVIITDKDPKEYSTHDIDLIIKDKQ